MFIKWTKRPLKLDIRQAMLGYNSIQPTIVMLEYFAGHHVPDSYQLGLSELCREVCCASGQTVQHLGRKLGHLHQWQHSGQLVVHG